MREFLFGIFGLAVFAGTPLTFVVAHEGHQMECNETGVNALKADIQSMGDGKAKTTAIKEMEMAQEMMAQNDVKACKAHMHNAMEAMEK